MPNWQWAAITKPEPPLAFTSNVWGEGCARAREAGTVIWFSTAATVPLPTRARPLHPALTVQLHALLGASALHPPPWGQRLLPGSRPPSMESSCGAGPPASHRAGMESWGLGTPLGQHSTAQHSGPAAVPGQRDFLLCCC